MTNQIAIIFGALIIGLSILGAQFVGRYEISAGKDAAGNPIVWRADARTGDIQICSLSESENRFNKLSPDDSKRFDVTCRSFVGGPASKP